MAKKASKPAVEELDDEIEELDDDEPTPAKKGKAATEDEVWGVRDLIKVLKKHTEKEYTPREVRTLLRKLAREGKLDREIVAGNKTRYSWSGPDDPEVKLILKAVKGGAIEAGKKEALDKLKADKAKKAAAKGDTPTKGKSKKSAPPADEDDEDDDDDE